MLYEIIDNFKLNPKSFTLHVTLKPVTWGWAVVFAGYADVLDYLRLASHELSTVGINVTKNEIPKEKSYTETHC